MDFLRAYVYPNETFSDTRSVFSDGRFPFSFFWRALHQSSIDEREVYFATSTFTAIAPFIMKEQRQRIINYSFYDNAEFAPLFPMTHSRADGMFLCPECAEEELSTKGYFYLHRAHHIAGVRSCHKHRCALCRVKTQYRQIDICKLPEIEPVAECISELEQAYSCFAKDILDAKLDCSFSDIRNIICTKMGKKKFPDFADEMENAGYFIIASSGIRNFIETRFKNNYPSVQSCLAILLYLYGDVQSVCTALDENKGSSFQEFYTELFDDNGFDLNDAYRNDVVSLTCQTCGTDFCASPYGFSIGWRCPVCDAKETLQEKYQNIVAAVGNHEYQATGQFTSMGIHTTIQHSCGKELKIKPRSFIYEGTRCNCGRVLGYEGVKRNIEQFEGFHLAEYTDITTPLVVKHDKCGKRFSFYYSKFMADPRCRACQRKGHIAVRSTDDFKEDMKDLVGEEYELIGEYNGPRKRVLIRHNTCGTTQEYHPYFFLNGGRCSQCHTDMNEAEFRDYVERASQGKYKVIQKATKNHYEIVNTKSGESVFMSMLKVRQELQRATPSPQLPLENRSDDVPLRPLRTSEEVYEKLRAQFGQDLIFTEDVGIDGKTVDEKASILGSLCNAGKLTHIAFGVYAFPECTYQTEEIIRARYIVRQGHRIGFFRGEDYAYEIGLLTEKPEEWHIATNKESVKTPNRKTMFLGQAIHIKGMPEPITDENHLILEAMDFLVQYKQCTTEPLETILIKMREHIIKNNNGKVLPYEAFEPYIEAYKTESIRHMMRRRIAALCKEGE